MFKKILCFLFCILITNSAAYSKSLSAKTLENSLTKDIKEEVQSQNLDVKVIPCSRQKNINKKIKKIYVEANNIIVENVSIPFIKASTLNETIAVQYKNNELTAINPLDIEFEGYLSESDINSALRNQSQILKNLKIKTGDDKYLYINLLNPTADIKEGSAILSANLYVSGMPEFLVFPVIIETGLSIKEDKIILNNFKIQNINIQSLAKALNNKDITIYNLKKLEEKNNIKANIQTINLKNDKITVKGTIQLPASSSKYKLRLDK